MTVQQFTVNREDFYNRMREKSQRKRQAAQAGLHRLEAARNNIDRAISCINAGALSSAGAISLLAAEEAREAFEALESHEHRAK